jgi:hypothetical protein
MLVSLPLANNDSVVLVNEAGMLLLTLLLVLPLLQLMLLGVLLARTDPDLWSAGFTGAEDPGGLDCGCLLPPVVGLVPLGGTGEEEAR